MNSTGTITAKADDEKGATETRLTWKHFPAGEHGFFRAPVYISGDTEAILIDAGFTYSDGNLVADALDANGRQLKTIYISHSDPDYYFSLGPIKNSFPSASIIAGSETVEAIERTVEKKLQVWGPKLKGNGPEKRAAVVIPQAFDGHQLTVDGESIEIVIAGYLPNRRYVWVPSLKAVFGGVLVFAGVHVWTADTPNAEARAAWVRCLDEIAARKPEIVVPGHLGDSAALDASSIEYTKSYLLAFEEEIERSRDSKELIAAMTNRYPGLGMTVALETGAKVAKGEMSWGQ